MAGKQKTLSKEGFPPPITFKMGRPPIYNKECPAQLLKVCEEGRHFLQACVEWGISEKTLYKWAKSHKEFGEALAVAQASHKAYWIQQGWENVSNKEYNTPLFKFMHTNYNDAYSDYQHKTLTNDFDENGKSQPFVIKVHPGEEGL